MLQGCVKKTFAERGYEGTTGGGAIPVGLRKDFIKI
jgi:hypothetical protein